MTTISRDDVQYLARLSSLQLGDDEVDGLVTDIENILSYIERLGELDTSNVEPTYQVTGLENVWRTDEIIDDKVGRERLLELAAESQNNSVKVPKVL